MSDSKTGVIEIRAYPTLNSGNYILKIKLSSSGAKGLGTELIKWSYDCNEGSHFHIEPRPYDIYEALGVFCLPESSDLIFESGFTGHEGTAELFDEDYDMNSDNTVSAAAVDVTNNAVLHNMLQFTFDKNAMRNFGDFLRRNNRVDSVFKWEVGKPCSEAPYTLFKPDGNNISAVEVTITENKCIDDFYT